jgi:hypothetical protein
VEWSGKAETQLIPIRKNNVATSHVARPSYYVIPVQYEEVIARMKQHGIAMQNILSDTSILLSMYRLSNPQIQGKLPNQGRCRLKADAKEESMQVVFPKGSVLVSTNQALGDLAVLLLEPEFTDSYFQWGFFPECLERTEYFETYVLEPYAADQLSKNPTIKSAFESKKSSDAVFAKDQQAQLRWFYEQSPYADKTYLIYPVGRIN